MDLPMPCDIQVEQALLGALILNNNFLFNVSGILEPEHFSEPVHGETYKAIVDLNASGIKASPVTIKQQLQNMRLMGDVELTEYLKRLYEETPSVKDAPNWAQIIRDMYSRRLIMTVAQETYAYAANLPLTESPVVLIERFGDETGSIVDSEREMSSLRQCEVADRLIEDIEKFQRGELESTAISSGFQDIDRFVKYSPEEVIVTAGRPGMGKSIFCTNSARRAAQSGLGVVVFPLENGIKQAVARQLADICYNSRGSYISYSKILRSEVGYGPDLDRIAQAQKDLGSLSDRYIIDDSSTITISRLGFKIRQYKARMASKGHKLSIVYIDHLDFIQASKRYSGNRTQEIGEIMIGLKNLARKEKICIHLFCQLNRAVEKQEDKRPGLSDLRNSGDIEQVADVVNFLYREAYYKQREIDINSPDHDAQLGAYEDVKNDLDVIIAKARSGSTGIAKLFCEPAASYVGGRL
jgi:replicative DNA helicase